MITAEDFDRWRDDAVTRYVFAAIEAFAAAQQEAWIQKSWGLGDPKPGLLLELRTRADAYRALIDTPYERWIEVNQDEPVYD